MLVGYARTSTLEQEAGLEAQVRDLKALGCGKVFSEQTSAVGPRKALEDALGYVREGDTFVVCRLDRLARSVAHLGTVLEQLMAKKVALRILDIGIDTGSATGELVLCLLGAVSQFERRIMLERQREGIEKARREGKYKGRKPTARAKSAEIRALASQGLSMGKIATQLGIGKGSVHHVLTSAPA